MFIIPIAIRNQFPSNLISNSKNIGVCLFQKVDSLYFRQKTKILEKYFIQSIIRNNSLQTLYIVFSKMVYESQKFSLKFV